MNKFTLEPRFIVFYHCCKLLECANNIELNTKIYRWNLFSMLRYRQQVLNQFMREYYAVDVCE